MNQVLLLVWTAVSLIHPTTAFADDFEYNCPTRMKAKAFSGIAIFDGDPTQDFQLKPYNGDEPFPHIWLFDSTEKPWVACKYGPKSEILLKKRLVSKFESCTMSESVGGSKVFDSVKCK